MNKDTIYLTNSVKFLALYTLVFISLLLGIIGYSVYKKCLSLYWFYASAIILFILLIACYYFVFRRIQKIKRVLGRYLNDYDLEYVNSQGLAISKLIDQMLLVLTEKNNNSKYLDLSQKQAQYLALQNQINPHFLYNTLECIRSEAVCEGIDNVATMTEALATFFRYTISNVERLVTLEDELTNVDNYYRIQRYRFGDKLNLYIDYDAENDFNTMALFMPKLILQPIVENAIYHGIERKVGIGNLKIKIDITTAYLIILVSDDGLGMKKDALEQLNQKLFRISNKETNTLENEKSGIAITNVNNRIKLLFGEEYGVHIHSTLNVGTDVEITLPFIQKN